MSFCVGDVVLSDRNPSTVQLVEAVLPERCPGMGPELRCRVLWRLCSPAAARRSSGPAPALTFRRATREELEASADALRLIAASLGPGAGGPR